MKNPPNSAINTARIDLKPLWFHFSTINTFGYNKVFIVEKWNQSGFKSIRAVFIAELGGFFIFRGIYVSKVKKSPILYCIVLWQFKVLRESLYATINGLLMGDLWDEGIKEGGLKNAKTDFLLGLTFDAHQIWHRRIVRIAIPQWHFHTILAWKKNSATSVTRTTDPSISTKFNILAS